MARNEIKVIITGDTRQFESALGRASKTSESRFKKIGRAAGVAGLALGGALALGAKAGFDELSQAAKVGAQTEAVIKSTGKAANVTAEQVSDLATSLMEKSGVDDEVIQSGENMLLTFRDIRNEVGKGNDIFDQATKATLDMSVAMGKDMPDAALIVGKALNDPVRGLTALRRVGVQFTKGQENAIKKMVKLGDTAGAQKIILEELNKEFGGSAEAAGKTLPGQLNIAKESFSNLAGEMMLSLLPAFTRLTELGLRFADFLKKNPGLAKAMVIGLAALTVALLAASVAQMALNLAVLANPYVAAIVGTIALGAAMVILYKKFAFVRRHWQLLLLVFGAGPVIIATIVKAIVRHFDSIKGALDRVKQVFQRILQFLRDFPGKAGSAAQAIGRAIARGVVDGVRGLASTLISIIRSAVNSVIDVIRGFRIGFPGINPPGPGSIPGFSAAPFSGIPHIATGGDISRTGMALVHRGEKVMPARVTNRGGGTGRFVILGDREFVDFLRGLDQDTRRTNGGRGILA